MSEEGATHLSRLAAGRQLWVTIDGPAGSGKTTVGRRLAVLLDAPLVDTGLMYREVTRRLLAKNGDPTDADCAAHISGAIDFSLADRHDESALFVDGQPLESSRLHTDHIDRAVSAVSAHGQVRSVLVSAQRELVRGTRVVMLGRDIGTVVLPDAACKIFLTASAEERARRRLRDRGSASVEAAEGRILHDISTRDNRDETRAISPLRPADDAVIIDTSALSIDATVKQALYLSIEPALQANG